MVRAACRRLWPHSLRGQILLSMAAALLIAQGISAVLLYRAQSERHHEMLVHTLAFRLYNAAHPERQKAERPPPRPTGPDIGIGLTAGPDRGPGGPVGPGGWSGNGPSVFRPFRVARFVPLAADQRQADAEKDLRQFFLEQDLHPAEIIVVRRPLDLDPVARKAHDERRKLVGDDGPDDTTAVLLGAVRDASGRGWLVARSMPPPGEPQILVTLIVQTLFIYALLVGSMAIILRRIGRPLAALTNRVEEFARAPSGGPRPQPLEPQGPEDLCRLIVAHNALEARITALLDEKDVMLGAIGHDLKTPLAALRVRIESVEDDNERMRMAATIEDLTRSLDDMLSLARVGRPTDPVETTELSALIASVVEEYEDMGEPVTLGETRRMALPLRATWLRRALRNLIGNALRYAHSADVTLERETDADGADWAIATIRDDGPGIPGDVEKMLEPFTRGDPSRNSETGGAGLGLTLARAIAEQHGGQLRLANRHDAAGAIVGLDAVLRLPLRKPAKA